MMPNDAPNPSGNRPPTREEVDIGLEPKMAIEGRCERCGGIMLPVRVKNIRTWLCTGRGCKTIVREAV